MNLHIVFAILLGALAAFLGGEKVFLLSSLAQSFLVLLKILVLPYLVFSLIYGISKIENPYRYFRKGLVLWGTFWLSTMLVLYSCSLLFPLHLPLYPKEAKLEQSLWSFSPLQVLLHENIAFVLLLSWLFGFCLMKTRFSLTQLSKKAMEVLYRVLQRVRPFLPIGIFLLSTLVFGSIARIEDFSALSYLLAYFLLASILIFVLFPSLILSASDLSYKEFFYLCSPSLLLSLALGNAWLVLPFAMDTLRKYYKSSKSSQESVSVICPLLYCLPNAGNFLFLSLLLFLSVGQFKFSGQGVILFSSAFTFFPNVQNLSWLLQKLLLPQKALHLYLQSALLAKHLQAAVTMTGVMSLSLLIRLSLEENIRWERKKIFRFCIYLLLTISAAASFLWIMI